MYSNSEIIEEVVLVTHSDYDKFPLGGITTYNRNLITDLPRKCKVSLIGLTTSDKYPVNRWSMFKTSAKGEGWLVPFFPVMFITESAFKTRKLPLKLTFSYSLFKKLLDKSNSLAPRKGRIYITSDIEPTIPILLFPQCKFITIRHGIGDFVQNLSTHPIFKHRVMVNIYLLLEKIVINKANKIIVVSEEGLHHYQNKFPKIKEKFILIPSGVNVHVFKPFENVSLLRKSYDIPSDEPCFLTACRLEPEKGLGFLLETFKAYLNRFGNATLVIAGKGTQEENLKAIASKLGISDRVRFLGMVTGSNLIELYNLADVFLLTSEWEGLPMAVLEALACGKPIVSTDVGEMRNLIVDGKTGYICQSRDTFAFSSLIKQTFDSRNQMSLECRNLAITRSTSVMVDKLLKSLIEK